MVSASNGYHFVSEPRIDGEFNKKNPTMPATMINVIKRLLLMFSPPFMGSFLPGQQPLRMIVYGFLRELNLKIHPKYTGISYLDGCLSRFRGAKLELPLLMKIFRAPYPWHQMHML